MSHRGSCLSAHHLVRNEMGFLASITASEPANVGSTDCPWLIRTARGRQINLTLLSFFSPDSVHVGPHGPLCNQGITVLDENATMQIPVCANGIRERRIYASGGHVLRIHVMLLGDEFSSRRTSQDTKSEFLIRYHGMFVVINFKESLSFRNKHV